MSNIITTIHHYCIKNRLISSGDSLIVGLSGGPDSVFLLHALQSLAPGYNLTLIAAHLDHGWRPESADDATFCAAVAQSMGITYISKKASEINLKRTLNGGSQEELGRALRRQFFEEIRTEHQAQMIALAHQRDDNLETLCIRLLRGAGLSGLSSIRPRHGHYIHPLLSISKSEILQYLVSHDIPFLIDYTNTHDTYLRNRIRQHVIPALRAVDTRCDLNAQRTIEHLQEASIFIEQLAQDTLMSISKTRPVPSLIDATAVRDIPLARKNKPLSIDLVAFAQIQPFLQKQVLLAWLCAAGVPFTPTQSFFDEILRFLASSLGGKHRLHPTWMIIKKHQHAHIFHD